MEIVRVRTIGTRDLPRPEAVSTPSLWDRPKFRYCVRIALFIAVFLITFLLFPRHAS